MLTTKLTCPDGGDREYIQASWSRAIARGEWREMRGHAVLMLGNADYVEIGGKLYSVNGDRGTPALPFGVRWEVTKYSNGHLDALAREQFALRAEREKTTKRFRWDCRCGAAGEGFATRRAAENDGDGHVIAMAEADEPIRHLTEVR